jgi:hypothetical protein
MRLLRSFPLLALTLVLLGIVGFCVAQMTLPREDGGGGAGLLFVAGALAVMSWYVTEGPRGRSLPRWVSNLLTMAVAINVVVDFIQHRNDPMGVLGRFTVWLTLIKLYERKTARDYAQVLALSLLLILTGCLQSQHLIFGLVLLAYAVLGLYVLLLYQLHAGFERHKAQRGASTPAGYRLAPGAQPILGRSPGLHFRWLVAFVGVSGMILSVLVFIIAPREIGGTGNRRVRNSVSGLNDEVNLIEGTRISESKVAVAFMQLVDRQNQPLHLQRPLLLRYSVLDTYHNGHWTSAGPAGIARTLTSRPPLFTRLGNEAKYTKPDAPAPGDDESGPSPEAILTQKFIMHGHKERNLLSVAVPVAVSTDQPATFSYDPATQLIAESEPGEIDSYTIQAVRTPSDETLKNLCGNEPLRWNRSGRFRGEPKVAELARSLLRDAEISQEPPEDPSARWSWNEQAAHVFQSVLQSSNFQYTIDLSDTGPAPASTPEVSGSPGTPGIPGSGGNSGGVSADPVVRFLTETRRGHCEYFASGLAALCHCVQIPARLVTGFVANEYDETMQRYVIRESNAHAWDEIQTGPGRWTTLDPTPPDTLRRLHHATGTFVDRLLSFYGLFEANWNNRVVLFDRKTQARLVGSLNDAWSRRVSDAADRAMQWMSSVNRAFDLGPAGYVWLGLVGFALALAMLAVVKLIRRWLRLRATIKLPRLGSVAAGRMLRQLGFYLDMLITLDRGGCAKPAWQPPGLFAQRLAADRPAEAVIVGELTDLFYASRYGGQSLDKDQLARAASLLAELAASLKRRA